VSGVFYGTLKSAWTDSPVHSGASYSSQYRSIGRASVLFGCVGGAWAFGHGVAEALRNVDDPINTVVGACCSAAVVGVYGRSPLLAAGSALAFSAAAVLADLSGSTLAQRTPREIQRLTTFHTKE
jgi:hypothetical protein